MADPLLESAASAATDTVEFFVSLGDALFVMSPILLVLVGMIALNGLIIGRLQGWKAGDALYHAFINATTVGYGDFRPTQGTAKFLSVLNAFLGLLLTGVFVGAGVYAVEVAVQLSPH